MADYIVTSGELTTVANAIREKNGTSSSLSWPNGFVSGISSGGGGESDLNNPIQLELAIDGNHLVTALTAGDIYALCQTGTPYFTVTAEQVATYHNLYKPDTKYFINEYFRESTDELELVGLRFVMLGIADTTDGEVKTMYDTTQDPAASTDHLIIASEDK